MMVGNILSITTLRLRPLVYLPFIGIVSVLFLFENAILVLFNGSLMDSDEVNTILLALIVSVILSIVFEGTQRRYFLMRSIYRRQKSF